MQTKVSELGNSLDLPTWKVFFHQQDVLKLQVLTSDERRQTSDEDFKLLQ